MMVQGQNILEGVLNCASIQGILTGTVAVGPENHGTG